MKRLFLINFLSLAIIFCSFTTAHAQTSQLGCCENQSSHNNIQSIESDCKGFQEHWTAGPCTSPTNQQTSPQDTQSGCTFNGQGEEKCQLENPIGATEVPALIKQVITVALGVIGSFTLLMLVWGGFQWLTSAGNPEKVSAGTQTMVWAVIGVMVVFASYVLLSTFLNIFVGG